MSRNPVSLSSSRPDHRILAVLGLLQGVCLAIVLSLGGITLLSWVIPVLGRILPHIFHLMRANTSLLITLSAVSIGLSLAKRSRNSVLTSRFLGAFIVISSLLLLCKNLGLITLPIETLLAADASSIYPGKVSPEAAFCFLLIGIILLDLRACKRWTARLMDAVTFLLCLVMLNFAARYLFGLSHLFALYQNNPFSVQTFVCFLLLTFLIGSRRSEYGLFSILLDDGTGGKTARFAAPIAVILPFLIDVPKAMLIRSHRDLEIPAAAAATSLLSAVTFGFALILARRTKALEATVRELSLRDELTGLYNRRGFYVLAEQAFQLARRSGEPFSVLFFDMDNLKEVNDTLGHEVGSELLKEISQLLVLNFRKTDVVARVGGDEFVVAGEAALGEIENSTRRLHEAVARANSQPNRKYNVSFSLGTITTTDEPSESLAQLLEIADARMYAAKRFKRRRAPDIPVV